MTFAVDPEVGAVLAAATESNGPPPTLAAGDIDGRRAALNPMLDYFNNKAQTPPGDVETSDYGIPAADGAELLARWYQPSSGGTGAAVLYLHGGGMIVGSVPIFDGPVARYVARSGVAMLSIQYRLAPEHPHPTPVEDAYAGLLWLADHAEKLGVDPARLAVMGDSAGGGLAAALAILARDRNGPRLTRQLLIYPMLDDRNTTPDPQLVAFAGWSYDDNITGWNALLGAGHEQRAVDPSASPARIADATGLPPAYIEVGQLDIFRDEDVRYALTLSHAGVPVELHLHPGVPHEYDAIAFNSDVARRAQGDRERVLRSL